MLRTARNGAYLTGGGRTEQRSIPSASLTASASAQTNPGRVRGSPRYVQFGRGERFLSLMARHSCECAATLMQAPTGGLNLPLPRHERALDSPSFGGHGLPQSFGIGFHETLDKPLVPISPRQIQRGLSPFVPGINSGPRRKQQIGHSRIAEVNRSGEQHWCVTKAIHELHIGSARQEEPRDIHVVTNYRAFQADQLSLFERFTSAPRSSNVFTTGSCSRATRKAKAD